MARLQVVAKRVCGPGGRAESPAVERPEMNALPKPLANEAQPGNPGMGGFGDRSLHVEMKDGFRGACALLGRAPPAGVAHARRTLPTEHHSAMPRRVQYLRGDGGGGTSTGGASPSAK